MTVIRQAVPRDAEAVAAIWNPYIAKTTVTFTTELKSSEMLADTIRARLPAFVVADSGADGALAGFATYGTFRAGPGYAQVMEHTVLLAPEAAGQGLGRALMTALEQIARQAGIYSLIGAVSGENGAGLAFHRAIGFAEVGRLPEAGCKFGRRIDLVLMQKRL